MGSSELDARAFAKRLDEALRERGVSLDDFALRTGHPRRQVATWTTSQNPKIPDPAILIAICRGFALSANHLLLGVGPSDLDAVVGRKTLSDELRETLRQALFARGHELPPIDAMLKRDGDVLQRLIDVYSLRLGLVYTATLFGLTEEQLSFAAKETETRYRRSITVVATPAQHRAPSKRARPRPLILACARKRRRAVARIRRLATTSTTK
jgi:transcriptional regulator with XRE-family HTH domain